MGTTAINYVYTSESKRSRLDLISDMPEIIISHILSSLPTKDAVRTCVLSRNWKYKWTCITDVDVSDNASIMSLTGYRMRHKIASYIRFVNRFIALSKTSRISRFRLYFHPNDKSELLQSWVTALLRRNLQRLDITAPWNPPIVSSSWLSGWTSLIDISLVLKCTLNISTVNCFPNLKSLGLWFTTFKSSGGCVLMNFPVLESLTLNRCQWLDVDSVVIHAPSLLKLETSHHEEAPKNYEIKLCAPKLDKFVSKCGEIRNMVLRAPAVTRATISHNYSLLKGFPNLKSLTLSMAAVTGLIKSRLISGLSTILHGVKEFKLGYFMGPDRIILEFLHWMPNLESLTIEMPRFEKDGEYYSGETPPFIYLKELTCKIGKRELNELAVFETILNKSKNLEKLSILASRERRELHSWLSKITNSYKGPNFLGVQRVLDVYVQNT